VDLPTYTNIWRIEKRLYKLYDFRLPAPLPITWIGVFVGITVPYVIFLIAVGLPFNHNLFWLYVLPPGVLTWLTTRPVIENKRLPELVSSQFRYISEPRTWCRMAPFSEKDEVMVTARVWHRHPPKAQPPKAKKSPAKTRSDAPARQAVKAGSARTVVRVPRPQRATAKPLAMSRSRATAKQLAEPLAEQLTQQAALPLDVIPFEAGASSPVQVPERTPSRRAAKRPQDRPQDRTLHRPLGQPAAEPDSRPSWSAWPQVPEPGTVTRPDLDPETSRPAAWASPPPGEMPAGKTLEVAHDSDPARRVLSESSGPTAWPSPGASLLPLVHPLPEPTPFPQVGAFPEVDLEPESSDAVDGESADGAEQGDDHGTASRSGSAPGLARWHLSGLRHSLGRKTDQPAREVPPPAGDAPPLAEAVPAAEAVPVAEDMPLAEGAPPAEDAPLAKVRARWMLRAQPRPAEASTKQAPDQREAEVQATAPEAQAPEDLTHEDLAPQAADFSWETRSPEADVIRQAPALEADVLRPPPAPEADVIRQASAPESDVVWQPLAPEADVISEPPALKAAAPAPRPAGPPAPKLTTPTAPALGAPALETATPEETTPRETTPEETAPEQTAPEETAPVASARETAAPETVMPEPRFVGVERGRPLPSIERALSGPGSRGDASSWRRQVKVVAGGQGPGKRDQETLDRDRARLPLAAPSLIAVLGCTRGAGQTVTALMTGHILATLRGVPVAALDLNPGPTSLSARRAPAAALQDLLAGREPRPERRPELLTGPAQEARLDVIASLPANIPGWPGNVASLPGHGGLEGADFGRLADLMTERYALTMIDPSPAGLTRVLAVADLLVLVAPASPDAATSLANTQQWLSAHGHGELAARAVTVVNGVSRRTKEDVLRAESVARGRCRAIVRVPWDDGLAVRPSRPSAGYPQVTAYPQVTLQPQARLAYTALAGVLAAALSASQASPVPGRNAGEHTD